MPHCNTTTAHQRPHKPLKRPVRAAHHLDLLRRLWPVLARLRGMNALKVERDENDQRKEPTISEKVALAEAIAEREKENAKHRQGQRTDLEPVGNISQMSETGRVSDILAQKVGLGSGKTLEAAQKVVERGIPELVEAMDRGKLPKLGRLKTGKNTGIQAHYFVATLV